MDPQNITKVTQIIEREDGSEVRIVAEAFFGAGLHRSIDIRVHHRDSSDQPWALCSERPHPDWLSMSVDDYVKQGRSQVMQLVSPGEILTVANQIGKPMPNRSKLKRN